MRDLKENCYSDKEKEEAEKLAKELEKLPFEFIQRLFWVIEGVKLSKEIV